MADRRPHLPPHSSPRASLGRGNREGHHLLLNLGTLFPWCLLEGRQEEGSAGAHCTFCHFLCWGVWWWGCCPSAGTCLWSTLGPDVGARLGLGGRLTEAALASACSQVRQLPVLGAQAGALWCTRPLLPRPRHHGLLRLWPRSGPPGASWSPLPVGLSHRGLAALFLSICYIAVPL